MSPSRLLRRLAQVALVAALCLASGMRTAHGQPPAARGAGDRAVVLFALPAVDPQTQAELREALLAQFALLSAQPRIESEPADAAGTSLGQRMSNAQARGAELGAIAVFWIEPEPDGRWLLHMMDSESERILVRAVDARGERRQAAIEAVAVMVRESTRALIEGVPVTEVEPGPPPGPPLESEVRPQAETRSSSQTEAGTKVEPERTTDRGPEAPPKLVPVETEPEQGPVRIWLGYHGDEFADGFDLQSGAGIGLSFFGLAPFYIGASFALAPLVKVQATSIDFEIQRLPFGLCGGFRLRLGEIAAVDFELGALLEILDGKEPTNPRAEQGFVLEDPQPTSEALFGLTGRVRGELFAAPNISFYAALGLDVLVNNFEYITRETNTGSRPVTVLQVMPVRPVAELGLAFYP